MFKWPPGVYTNSTHTMPVYQLIAWNFKLPQYFTGLCWAHSRGRSVLHPLPPRTDPIPYPHVSRAVSVHTIAGPHHVRVDYFQQVWYQMITMAHWPVRMVWEKRNTPPIVDWYYTAICVLPPLCYRGHGTPDFVPLLVWPVNDLSMRIKSFCGYF